MGILDMAEEAAGAFAADKALEAVDPNANFIEKAAAAVAGFEGVKAVKATSTRLRRRPTTRPRRTRATPTSEA